MNTRSGPDIFGFTDYRGFLLAVYEARKEADPSFSYARFATRAGYKTPAAMHMICTGRDDRHISEAAARRLADWMELGEEERRHFNAMIGLARAKTDGQKQKIIDRMQAFRRFRDAVKVQDLRLLYFSRWFYTVIREMAMHPDFVNDSKWISRHIRFRVDVGQVEGAVERLVELGVLKRESGRLVDAMTSGLLAVGHKASGVAEASKLVYRGWYKEMLHRAAEALDIVPVEERHSNSLTIRMSAEQFEAVKPLINGLIEEVNDIIASDYDKGKPNNGEVYRLDVLLFPLTKIHDKEGA